ncbi:hypothetical protein SLEP1_g20967 [Rubroshorea leprosula]|uniref:Uncharacterized protein n=1 Tax=Rubroshorea leprosula TaxID=152421 RepID=A0AAV5J4E3_9ROSI|nr:hypothetical protein SLEP1_g20967 [Rubroshorea leprosula]
MPAKLGCVIVAVEVAEDSMAALRWFLHNIKLRTSAPNSCETPGSLVILHAPPPSIPEA